MFLSIRDAMHSHLSPPKTVAAQAQTLRTLQMTHIEVWLDPDNALLHWTRDNGETWRLDSLQDAREFRQNLQAHNVQISALCLPTDFAAQVGHVDWAIKAIELAHELGAQMVRIDPATHDAGISSETVRQSLVRGVLQVLAGSENMPLGIENHGRYANDVQWLQRVFEEVDSPRLGLTLDAGNFYWFGFPLSQIYDICAQFAPRTLHTHCKNIAYPQEMRQTQREIGWEYGRYACGLGEGDLDWNRIAQILRGAGYQGDLCIENETLPRHAPEARLQVLASDALTLREVL